MERIFGYARVSSIGQNLYRQILALKEYVPKDNIIIDKQSGKNLDRPGYQALKSQLGLRAGDKLYITSLDRLSRNKNDIKEELKVVENERCLAAEGQEDKRKSEKTVRRYVERRET